MSKKVTIIAPDAYPQLASPQQRQIMSRILRSAVTAVRANETIEENTGMLKGAVFAAVRELEESDEDAFVVEKAHDIRGLAATAGLPALGQIADNLWHYYDEMRLQRQPVEKKVVALHVRAMARAVHLDSVNDTISATVVRELEVLVSRKLGEVPPVR